MDEWRVFSTLLPYVLTLLVTVENSLPPPCHIIVNIILDSVVVYVEVPRCNNVVLIAVVVDNRASTPKLVWNR